MKRNKPYIAEKKLMSASEKAAAATFGTLLAVASAYGFLYFSASENAIDKLMTLIPLIAGLYILFYACFARLKPEKKNEP